MSGAVLSPTSRVKACHLDAESSDIEQRKPRLSEGRLRGLTQDASSCCGEYPTLSGLVQAPGYGLLSQSGTDTQY